MRAADSRMSADVFGFILLLLELCEAYSLDGVYRLLWRCRADKAFGKKVSLEVVLGSAI